MHPIASMILGILGLGVKDNAIFDWDTNMPLLFNGNPIIPPTSPIIHRGDEMYDPVCNKKLAKYLFGICITKEEKDNGLNLESFYPIYESQGDFTRCRIELKIDSAPVSTPSYYLESLAYCHAIFILSGLNAPADLKDYDSAPIIEK